MYIGRIIIYDNNDPPRRLMEEALEKLLKDRNESSSICIEFVKIGTEYDAAN